MQKLREAGIKPTLKCIVFLDSTLANHAKHMLVSMSDQNRDGTILEKEDVVVVMLQKVQQQLQEQQHQHQLQMQQLTQQLQSLQQ